MSDLRERVIAALEAVNDPHVPASLRAMGMLNAVVVDDNGLARVQICIPCMACPGMALLRDAIGAAVRGVPGIRDVVIEEGWHLPWSPEMVSDEVRTLMRANGIQL